MSVSTRIVSISLLLSLLIVISIAAFTPYNAVALMPFPWLRVTGLPPDGSTSLGDMAIAGGSMFLCGSVDPPGPVSWIGGYAKLTPNGTVLSVKRVDLGYSYIGCRGDGAWVYFKGMYPNATTGPREGNGLVGKMSPSETVQWVHLIDPDPTLRNTSATYDTYVGSDGTVYSVGLTDLNGRNPSSYPRNYLNIDDDLLVSKVYGNGTVAWARYYGDTGNDEAGYAVTVDPTGSIYVAGITNMGPGVTGRDSDILLMKLDPDGNLLWSRSIEIETVDGELHEEATDLLYLDGVLLLVGVTDAYRYAHEASMESDILLVAIDPGDGSIIWAKTYDTGYGDFASSIYVGQEGYIYITGHMRLAPYPSEELDALILKLEEDGSLVWAYRLGGSLRDKAHIMYAIEDGVNYVSFTSKSYSSSGQESGVLAFMDGLIDLYWVEDPNRPFVDIEGQPVTVSSINPTVEPYSIVLKGDAEVSPVDPGFNPLDYRSHLALPRIFVGGEAFITAVSTGRVLITLTLILLAAVLAVRRIRLVSDRLKP